MPSALRCLVVTLVSFFATGCQSAPSSPAPGLHGAWRMTNSEMLLPDGDIRVNPVHESFLLFTDGYYSMGWAGGAEPAPPSETPLRPTDDEKLARFGTLLVNSGRYHTEGNTLTIDPLFALVPEYVGGGGVFEYHVDADTLTLRWTDVTSSDGQPDPLITRGFQWRYTLIRLPDR